ncbi:hypothetical protein FRC17_004480 [Serendipita sp. 399]|nr:hypothetical protein FRC17_004480 [Serendipita sp. 399]
MEKDENADPGLENRVVEATVESDPKPESTDVSSNPTFPDGGLRAWDLFSLVLPHVLREDYSFGIAVAWGAFQAYYEQNTLKGYSSSSIAWIGSLQFSLIFMPVRIGSITGRLLDMGYHKLPLGLASIVLVLCAFLTAECSQYWHFLLCQGIGIGFASGVIFPPTLGLMSQWFHKRRATAFGITACGTSLGGAVFPIMIRFLLPSVGFKWTVRILAFVMSFALLLGFLTTATRLPPRPVKRIFGLDVVKSKNVLFYAAASFFAFLGMYTILTFLVVSAVVKGIDRNLAFYFVSIMNVASIVGRIMAGILGDNFGPLNVMIPFTMGAALVTYCWPYAHSVAGFVLIAVFYGVTFGAYVGLLPSPAASLGPLHSIGERIGFQLTIMSIAILIGSPIAGAIRDLPLGFRGAGAYAGSFIVLGVGFMMLTKKAVTKQWLHGRI